MKYICIGDIHGKIGIVDTMLSSKFDGYHKIFLGDYVDSFTESTENMLKCVKTLLEASEREDVTVLLGNHELSYLKEGMKCSGHRGTTRYGMVHLKDEILSKFKTHFWLTTDILATHAGASGSLFSNIEELKQALDEDNKKLYNIGSARGGWSPVGGIFWCDYWDEFEELEGLTQIVGHSSYRPEGQPKGIGKQNNCFNIDCLDRIEEVLIVDTDKEDVFKIVNFNTYEG